MSKTFVNNEIVLSTEEANKCEADKSPEFSKLTGVNYDLSKFSLQSILNNNTRSKSIALLGTFPDLSDSDKAIVIFEKKPFQESEVSTSSEHDENCDKEENGNERQEEIEQTVEKKCLMKRSYFCSDLKVQTEFINNIYGSYKCTPPPKLSDVKATVVYPATDKHIEKYSICQKFIVNETPQLYDDITLPYITSSQFSLEWVYNILEHKQETERFIFEDPDPDSGFILLPDLKWDGHNMENLYVLAIVHKRDIKSIRDLNSSHLPLLRNLRSRAAEAIESRYGILSTQLRMYLHYQPSFYHLHIHINPVRSDAPGIWCEKSHMLDTVINNLELLPDYYKKATLPFVLYGGNKLLELYEAKMEIRRVVKCLADNENNEDIKPNKRKFVKDSTEEPNEKTQAMAN